MLPMVFLVSADYRLLSTCYCHFSLPFVFLPCLSAFLDCGSVALFCVYVWPGYCDRDVSK